MRLGFGYAAVFAVLGIWVPFWPLWLEGRGFRPSEVAILLSAGIWVRAVVGPLWGQWADRRSAHRRTMRRLAWAAVAVAALLLARLPFWPVLCVLGAFGLTFPPLVALLEGVAIRLCEAGGRSDYGRVRLWGSLSFLLVSAGAGRFLEGRSQEWVLVLVLAALVVTACATLALPDPGPLPAPRRAPIREVLRDRSFLLLVAAVTWIQGSHACYYAFSAIHWEHAGIGRDTIGLLWAEGVVAETILFAVADRVLPFRPATLLLIGAGAAILRWTVTAETTSVAVLAGVQWLHGATFGVTHIASVRWIGRNVDPARITTAQTVLASVAVGLGIGVATPLTGGLFEAAGGAAFFAMVAMAGLGLLAALWLRGRPRRVVRLAASS